MATESPLRTVVALNEASKVMQDHADQVRLRALDALVRSVRTALEAPPGSVNTLAGFREVSTQMRQWSDGLATLLTHLRKVCSDAVLSESAQLTQRRRAKFLDEALSRQKAPHLREKLREVQTRQKKGRDEVRKRLDAALQALQDLKQAGLMATVLARTAKIEAWSGDPSQRDVLAQVAVEFGEHAQEVLTLGRRLMPSTQKAREAA